MATFIEVLFRGLTRRRVLGVNNAFNTECEETIDHYSFYQGFLIPAILITFSFGFTIQRRQMFPGILNGRPGIVFPMDIMTRHTGMSYAAAFGSTLHLVYLVIFQQKAAFEQYGLFGPSFLIIIPSMIIYGLVYFPVFACLAIRSTYGYIMGSLYIWSFTALSFYKEFQCAHTYVRNTNIALFFRRLPQFACLLFLCVSITGRCYKAFKTKKNIFETISEEYISENLQDIKASYVGRHVRKLFIKPPLEQRLELPQDFKGKLLMKLKLFWNRLVYKRDADFEYSSRFKSVVFVGVLLVYSFSTELLIRVISLSNLIHNMKLSPRYGDVQELNALEALRFSLILSLVCTIFWTLISILHTMTSYRKNLRDLHKGIHTHITAINTRSNSSLLTGSMRYAGYQLSYIAVGLVVQTCVFVLLFKIIWLLFNAHHLFITVLSLLWPFILFAVIINVLQILFAKFLFLQERGSHLAFENRRMLFSFTYFMFFYNIFLGLISCLLQIVKAIVLGAIILSRLDNSTLPPIFQFFDPGFSAYVGFMHIENSHNHPVVLTLVRILLASRRSKLKSAQDVSVIDIESGTGTVGPSRLSEEEQRRKKAARFNWHVTYTLFNNPGLRIYRKEYLQTLSEVGQGCFINPVYENVSTGNTSQEP